jgi:signal transduction histidine kinase
LAVSAAVLWEARRSALDDARAMATNLAALLHEQTSTVFQTTDLALRSAKRRLEREPLAQDDPGLRADLTAMREELGYIRALFVIGPDGFITHDTDYPRTPRVSLADRRYFEVHRDNPGLSIFVGEPLLSRSVFRWFVPLARRIDNADGSFAGVVVAAIEPAFFERTYRRLQMHDLDAIALFHADSTLIARAPPLQEMYGRELSNLKLFAPGLPRDQRGVFETENVSTGRTSIVAYRKLDDFPLIITVALDQDEALDGWRLFAWAIALAAFLVGSLILLHYSVMARRRLKRQVARQKALTAEKLEAVGLMTSSVAHDFNNLLAATSAAVHLLRKRGPDETLLSGIEEAVERGMALTGSLLRFAKDQDQERRLCSPNQRIDELKVLIRQSLPPGVRLQMQLSPDVDWITVSPALFDAAIINLVVNAVHAMPAGGELHIATANRPLADGSLPSGGYVSVSVADTGCGIPPPALEHIFDPFFTTKGESGTGLGLFQVRNFAQEAGGDVRVTSALGAGTQVKILIPSASPWAEKAVAAAPETGGSTTKADSSANR